MADQGAPPPPPMELEPGPFNRPLGATEHNWCRAVDTGTGITILGLLFRTPSAELRKFQEALDVVQWRHPRLRSRIVYMEQDKPGFQVENQTSQIQELVLDESSEDWLVHVEEEMNTNPWLDHQSPVPVFFANLYRFSDSKSLFMIRAHTAACDRAAVARVMSEFLHTLRSSEARGEVVEDELLEKQLVSVEDAIPRGQANKPFWAHGVDLLGYSLGSLRHALLPFQNIEAPRRTKLIRAFLSVGHTRSLLKRCSDERTNLFGAITGAGLLATTSSKELGNRSEHFAMIGLVDCRKHIEMLSSSTIGFYHSAILNTHQVNEVTGFWDLARRCSDSFTNAIRNRKHFTDMGNINYLMYQALQHPNLTPASTLRTSLMVVFQDAIADESGIEVKETLGLEDYVGCASIHGVGPSLAMFDSIRDGALHCNVVYPEPLHSREQMQGVVDKMMSLLVESLED